MLADRVSVVGAPGSGKSRVGREVARLLGLPYVELDAIYHQPGWQPLDEDRFRERVGEIVADPSWVIDGNYSMVRDIVWDRAQTVIWLDLPRPLVMRRLVARTLWRGVTRQRLWNGNRERWTSWFRWDPMQNLLRWTWTRYPVYRERYAEAMVERGELEWIRLTTPRAVDDFMAGLRTARDQSA